MRKDYLQARLHFGSRIKLIATNRDKSRLVVLLSSRLEREQPGVYGDIVDTKKDEVVYTCSRMQC